MEERSRHEVARRAGVDPEYIDRLAELGILKPGDGFSPGDVRRARWVRSLERAGVPLDGMAAAVQRGKLSFSFLDVTAFDRFTLVSDTTFRELSERTGVPMELLKVVREAAGSAEPQPEGESEPEAEPLHSAGASSRPAASPGMPSLVAWPSPNFCWYSYSFSLPSLSASLRML